MFTPAAKFYTVVPDIVTIIRAVSLPYNNWSQFKCTEHKAPGSNEAHWSLRNCWPSVCNLLHVSLLALRILWSLPDFLKVCWPLAPILTSALDLGSGQHRASGRFSPGNKLLYLLNTRLGEPQSRSGRFLEEKYLLPFRDTKSGSYCP
jgi:hypothetical protein